MWWLDTDLGSVGQTGLEDDAKPFDPLLSMRRAPSPFMHRAKAVLWVLEPCAVLDQEPDHLGAHLIRLPGADRSRQGHRTGPLDDGGVLVQECFHPPEVLPPVPVLV